MNYIVLNTLPNSGMCLCFYCCGIGWLVWVFFLWLWILANQYSRMCYPSKHVSGMFLYCWQCTWLCASVSSEARFLWRRTSNASLNINPVYPNPHLPPPLSSRRRRRHHPAVSLPKKPIFFLYLSLSRSVFLPVSPSQSLYLPLSPTLYPLSLCIPLSPCFSFTLPPSTSALPSNLCLKSHR